MLEVNLIVNDCELIGGGGIKGGKKERELKFQIRKKKSPCYFRSN